MIRNVRLGRVLVLVLALLLAADRAPGQAPSAPPPAAAADYKIAFWYHRSDPLNTFHYQVYDLRQGQYTGAVEDWLRTMQANHPDYAAYVKDLRLKPDSGQTER